MRATWFTSLTLWTALGFAITACSSVDRDFKKNCSPDDENCAAELRKREGNSGGLHESAKLTEGLTGLWWSASEDFFVAGLHRDNEPEPPQVGIYFGSLSNPTKRTIHWFPGEAPGGEDLIGVRVYKDEKSKMRIYFLSQLQNAGFYFPAFYFFSTDSLMTTSLYSRINCEQIEDLEIISSGLNIRCRRPVFGDDGSDSIEYSSKKEEDSPSDVSEISMDVDPSVTTLTTFKDEQHRDWLSGVLRSCVQVKGQPNLCYPK